MGFSRFDEPSPPRPPAGYGVRAYRPGDERAWIEILSTGDFGVWDRPRLERMLAGERAQLPREGIRFATVEDRPVGAACAFLHASEREDVPELGWVAVHPEHRGRGLGLQVCRAVLGYVGGLGHTYAYLLTEDFRLAAITTYLRLCFEPEMTDPSQRARWLALRTSVAHGRHERDVCA